VPRAWGIVLNEADNQPGGEVMPDGDQVASRCRDAGEERFAMAVASASGAAVLALAAVACAVVTYRRDPDAAGAVA